MAKILVGDDAAVFAQAECRPTSDAHTLLATYESDRGRTRSKNNDHEGYAAREMVKRTYRLF